MTVGRASRLQGIEAFVETVEGGSFARAAATLGLSRSAVAKAVARLETHLGVRLFERTARSVVLTAEGERFHAAAVGALAALEAGERDIAARQGSIVGKVVLSLPVSFGRHWLLRPLLALMDRYRELALDIRFSDRFVSLVEENVDIAVRIGDAPTTGELMTRRLAALEAVICAAPAYLAERGAPETLADLSHHRSLTFVQDGRVSPWRFVAPGGAIREVIPTGPHAVSHGDALTEAAIAGHGLALLPRWLACDALASGALVPVLREHPLESQTLRLVWRASGTRFPRTRAVLDALAGPFAEGPPWRTPAQGTASV